MQLVNARTNDPIATDLELAVTRETRRRGLLGRDGLEPSAGLILSPCAAVHTAFMRFPIDLVFVDRDGCVVKMVHDLPPWRMAVSPQARSVVELPAGSLRLLDIAVGDRLYVDGPTAIRTIVAPR